jgi:hypothetical protein
MLGFAELGLRLIELHQPLDAGGGAGRARHSGPLRRCWTASSPGNRARTGGSL